MGRQRTPGPAARVAEDGPGDVARPGVRSAWFGDRAIVLAIWLVALILRTVFSYAYVFQPSYVNFQDPDAWYHMRLVDALVANFPQRVTVDPYVVPGGAYIPIGPFFDYLVAIVALVIGLGSPSTTQVETVAAFLPAVLGATVVIPVYWMSRHVFGRPAGLLAAALIAILPGPFLQRTKLGLVDHHVAEVLLSVTTVLLLMRAIARVEQAGEREARQSWVLAGLAGVAWGAYLLAWTSGVLLSAIVVVWAVGQILLDAMHGRSDADVSRVVVPAALVAAVLLALFETASAPRYGTRMLSVLGTAGVVLALEALRRAVARAGARPPVLVAGTASVLTAAAVLIVVAAPSLVASLWAEAGRLAPSAVARSVGEVQPLFSATDGSGLSLLRPWDVFGPAFFVAAAALWVLGSRVVREARPGPTLLFVYSLVMFVATIGQSRFGYYLAVNLAVLSGWASVALIQRADTWASRSVATVRAKDRPAALRRSRAMWRGVAATVVLAVLFVPTSLLALTHIAQDSGMEPAWHGALEWLRKNTPEPFADPTRYESSLQPGESVPAPLYTVMNWWELGYYVVRVGRRVPAANPTQFGAVDVGRFLTATDPDQAARQLEAARSRYVLLSDDLVYLPFGDGAIAGKLRDVAEWAGKPRSSLVEYFYQPGGAGPPVTLFYADYYRSMSSRLLLFGGQAAHPELVYVITWVEERRTNGETYKAITGSRRFEGYGEAEKYLSELGPGNHAIVGRDPLKTCVPLEARPEYRLVYESPDGSRRPTGMGSVRIYEFLGGVPEAEADTR